MPAHPEPAAGTAAAGAACEGGAGGAGFDGLTRSGPLVSELLALVADSDVVELDVWFEGGRVSLRRPPTSPSPSVLGPQSSVGGSTEAELGSLVVTSPLVGIFHPDVTVGDQVDQGQAIGAIEALGLPTSVDAPQGGAVEDLLVDDGQPVEYGQPLLVLRRARA